MDENSLKVLLNERKTVGGFEEEEPAVKSPEEHALEEEEPEIDLDNIKIEDVKHDELDSQMKTDSKEENTEDSKVEESVETNDNKQETTDQLRLTLENSDRIAAINRGDLKRASINRGLCTTCREVKGGKYLPLLGDRLSDEEILKKIPRNATIVHVISGADFPASVNPNINKIANGRDVIYAITKADMIVTDKGKVKERVMPYIKDEMNRLFGVDPEKVFLLSAMRTWYVNELYNALPKLFYLVGYSNVGKTKLAHAISQKDNCKANVPIEIQQRFYGSNDIPGMTHDEIAYPLQKMRMVDLPPVGKENDAIWNVLKDENVLDIAKGKSFARRSICISVKRQVLSKPGWTLSLGGLVFLETPKDSTATFIVWAPMQRYETVVQRFNTYEKAVDRAATQVGQHKDWFVTKPYDKKDAPPELVPEKVMELSVKAGGIDLSVFGLGHIQIRANGSIPKEGHTLNVYALPGIKVVTKTPLLSYLQDYKDQNQQPPKSNKKFKKYGSNFRKN
ncbi:hypothetical protein DV495_004194 [Geotrichum candidum]|nr:hypothetical protein DV495_004194 [Geotrichum candidum]